MEKFFNEINKYIISILMFVAGLGFLAKYLSGDELESQPLSMLLASLALILVGGLAMPVVLEKLNQTAYRVMMGGGALVAISLGYAVFNSVDEEIRFQETQLRVNKATIQRLTDIRDAQEMHLELYGNFADSFDSLTAFIHAEVVPVEFSMGSFHDTLPESKSREEGYVIKRGEVAELASTMDMAEDEFLDLIANDGSAYKVRDTLYTSFFAENFDPAVRRAKKLPAVSMDSLYFSPFTGERFVMKFGVVEVGRVPKPSILVQDPTPFGREGVRKDTLRFGSLNDFHRDGNWRN